jgi:hypothetical protein
MPGMGLDKEFPVIGAALEIGPGKELGPGVKADGALPQHPPVAGAPPRSAQEEMNIVERIITTKVITCILFKFFPFYSTVCSEDGFLLQLNFCPSSSLVKNKRPL